MEMKKLIKRVTYSYVLTQGLSIHFPTANVPQISEPEDFFQQHISIENRLLSLECIWYVQDYVRIISRYILSLDEKKKF